MNLFRVEQKLVSSPLTDVRAEVNRQLDSLNLQVPSGEVAITVGSRGIDRIPEVIRAAGDWLRAQGARPFMIPAMGSHNGATAEGQRAMVESLGMTEEAMGMEIRSSMDVVKIGSVSSGDVWMDRNAFESDGVLVINRLKLHTGFAGPLQSGLTKMMVVGMGKTPSARTFHSASTGQMKDMLEEMGRTVLASGKILAGLALLEDGYDQLAELHALRPDDIPLREPILLDRHREMFPRLPVDALNVLVVEEIGKVFSGTGMDTNVIGRRGVFQGEDLDRPCIRLIAALGLSPRSQGNAVGVGLADVITRRLKDAVDEKKTFINAFTTGEMARVKIPAAFETDEELVRQVEDRFGAHRWMFIPNTLELGVLYVSEDLAKELMAHPACTVDPVPVEPSFAQGRLHLPWIRSPLKNGGC